VPAVATPAGGEPPSLDISALWTGMLNRVSLWKKRTLKLHASAMWRQVDASEGRAESPLMTDGRHLRTLEGL
jgi:hypothetical protein